MSADSAGISSFPNLVEHESSEQPDHEMIVMFIERGKKTDEFGWLNGFDGLNEYLGRMS